MQRLRALLCSGGEQQFSSHCPHPSVHHVHCFPAASRFQGKEGQAVIKLALHHFAHAQLPALLSPATAAELTFRNDVYAKVRVAVPMPMSYPASACAHRS